MILDFLSIKKKKSIEYNFRSVKEIFEDIKNLDDEYQTRYNELKELLWDQKD